MTAFEEFGLLGRELGHAPIIHNYQVCARTLQSLSRITGRARMFINRKRSDQGTRLARRHLAGGRTREGPNGSDRDAF
jgi:hypothetical protein